MTEKTHEQQIADLIRERDYLRSILIGVIDAVEYESADYNIPHSLYNKINAYINEGVLHSEDLG